MGKRLYFKFQIIWILIIIPLFSYLLLKKTLNLALYGDDWEQLYNLWLSFDVYKALSFYDIRSYLNPYWPQYLFLGIIRHFFGYEPAAYFASSLFLRILATISLFFLVKKLTNKSFPAYLSTLIFTFSVTGLQTTDWVFNMNTYAGVFFLNFSFILYLKLRNSSRGLFFLRYLLFIAFFTLALGVVPVRMHGSIIFLWVTESFLIFSSSHEKKFKMDKYFFLRITTPVIILLTLLKLGSFGNPEDNISIKSNLTFLETMIQKGRTDILFYFLGIVGNFVLPDTIISTVALAKITFMGLYFIIADSILTLITKGGKRMFIYLILSNIPGLFLAKMLLLWNPLLSSSNILSILIGIHLILVSFILFWQFKKSNWLPVSLIIIGLIWLISFSFLYWFKTPYSIIETTSRYLTVGAFGFSILFSGLIWLMIERVQFAKKFTLAFLIPIFLLLFWLKINFEASNIYLTHLEENRNINLVNKAWNVLLRNVPEIDKEAPSVFYFTTDNSTAIYMIFSFGFPPHGGLLYEIPEWLNTPIPTEHYEELFKMVSNGEILQTLHGRKPFPISLSRVFAFDFRNGELTSMTDLVRQQLSKDLQSLDSEKAN